MDLQRQNKLSKMNSVRIAAVITKSKQFPKEKQQRNCDRCHKIITIRDHSECFKS